MCLKFLTRNGGKYPKSLDDLISDDYFSKEEADEIFYSPFATSKDSYSNELLLPGAGIPKDKRTIVMRCKYAGPDGKTTVVFGDGHIERIVVEKPKENGSGK